MYLNIVCTSKPVDGLLFYSYEYCSLLNLFGIKTRLVIICHKKFNREDYINSINSKYIHCNNVFFDDFVPGPEDISLIMGRSMMTLSWIEFKYYSESQKKLLMTLFSNKLISVYSENHPVDYLKALEFYSPLNVVDLCDTEVYPNGVGKHFEKRINFEIYKPFTNEIKFEYLFMGTNNKYYATAEKFINKFPNYGILTYSNADFINYNNNNIFVPVTNLIGIFDTYVYTKETFDPAPRIIQECKYFKKNAIYLRDESITDGGSVYWNRDTCKPDINPILWAIEIA